jgi:hypothetical protein
MVGCQAERPQRGQKKTPAIAAPPNRLVIRYTKCVIFFEARLALAERIRTSSRAAANKFATHALPFGPRGRRGLVGFLLHPVPHCGTRRRLFPCKLRREAHRFVNRAGFSITLLARSDH